MMFTSALRRASSLLPRHLAVSRSASASGIVPNSNTFRNTNRRVDSNAGANILGLRFFSKIKKVNKTEREAGRAWRERQRCIEVGEEPEEEEECGLAVVVGLFAEKRARLKHSPPPLHSLTRSLAHSIPLSQIESQKNHE